MKLRALALVALLVSTLCVTGCKPTASQVSADGAALAQSLNAIAALETQQGNAALASQLGEAAKALTAATANWQTGSAVADINDAATLAEIALAAIPTTAAFAPLVPIAVAAIDALLANVGGSTTATSSPAVGSVHAATPKLQHRVLRSPEGDFKAAWNGQVKASNLSPSLLVK